MFHVDLYRLDDAADALAGGPARRAAARGRRPRRVGGAPRVGAARGAAGRGDRRLRRRAAADRAPRGRPVLPAIPGGARDRRRRASWSWTPRRRRAVIALGTPDGALLATRSWAAGYRHGEELLARIEALLAEQARRPRRHRRPRGRDGPRRLHRPARGDRDGEGPRVRPATCRSSVSHGRGAAGGGRRERRRDAARPRAARRTVRSRPDPARRAVADPPGRRGPRGCDPASGWSRWTSTAASAPEAATLGAAARDGLAAAMLRAGAARLAAGDADDLARLVPEYVTLPRGVRRRRPDDGGVALTGDEAPR